MKNRPPSLRVTQRVDPATMPDLLRAPRRAALAFTTPDGPECIPAIVRQTRSIEVGVARTAWSADAPPERATLLVDDGWWWFELRAIVRRGRVESTGPDADGIVWLRFEPTATAAWNYGALHEEVDGDAV